MSKLSATSTMNVEEIPRTELTPELIKTMSDEELTAHLVKLRGNREVTGASSGTKNKRSPIAKPSKDDKSDEEDIFG